jgi:hypothetical protein
MKPDWPALALLAALCAAWLRREAGMDRHSVVPDTLFTDPEKGDFRLREKSPALDEAVGFVLLELNKVGPRR